MYPIKVFRTFISPLRRVPNHIMRIPFSEMAQVVPWVRVDHRDHRDLLDQQGEESAMYAGDAPSVQV